MSRNPYVDEVLAEIQRIHDSKNEDYASDENPFSNFEGTAQNVGITAGEVLEVFIANKSERLRKLRSGHEPNHESIRDNLLDRAVYAVLTVALYDYESDSGSLFMPPQAGFYHGPVIEWFGNPQGEHPGEVRLSGTFKPEVTD